MVLELRDGSCYPKALAGINVALACVDSAIAVLAFYQVSSVPDLNLFLYIFTHIVL